MRKMTDTAGRLLIGTETVEKEFCQFRHRFIRSQ